MAIEMAGKRSFDQNLGADPGRTPVHPRPPLRRARAAGARLIANKPPDGLDSRGGPGDRSRGSDSPASGDRRCAAPSPLPPSRSPFALPAGAEPLPVPAGEAVLTIKGAVPAPNAGADVALDLATIQGLGSASIETTTDWEWHEGAQTFSGVPLLAVLDAAGATGDTITVTAIDEYAVTMSRDALEQHGALLATALNGEPLTEESFGPLWLVFPYDEISDPAERKLYTERSVWSVVGIQVE